MSSNVFKICIWALVNPSPTPSWEDLLGFLKKEFDHLAANARDLDLYEDCTLDNDPDSYILDASLSC